MKLHGVTGLGRPLDPAHHSNRLAIVLTVTAAIVTAGLSWLLDGTPDPARSGAVAVGGFLAWAIGRELDPDQPRTGMIAMIVSGVLALFAQPALIVSGVILLGVRILAGTVGTHLRALDQVLLVGAASVAATQPVAWPAVALLAYALLRDPSSGYTATIWAVGAGAVGGAFLGNAWPNPVLPGVGPTLLVLAVASVGIALRRVRRIASTCDAGVRRISAMRVTRARTAAVLATVGGAVINPDLTLALGPAMAAILALLASSGHIESVGRLRGNQSVDVAGPAFAAQHPLAAQTSPPVP